MADTFLLGDTHLGHKNIIKFQSIRPFRPFDTIEEHDEEIIRRWNSVVRKKDIVIHTGDFAFGAKSIELAYRLNGDKRLVMGNHDHYPTELYAKYFTKLYGSHELDGFLITHIPVHPTQFARWKGNIHGHLHHEVMPDPRYINVSCEQVNLTPISFDVIRDRFEAT